MRTKLLCECCGERLLADFCGNVWCENKDCLLKDQPFNYEFIEARAEAKKNQTKLPTKQFMPQIRYPNYG